MLPEYLCDRLPVAGRGLAMLDVTVTRPGEPVHEVLGGLEQPNVIAAGAEIVRRFVERNDRLAQNTHPLAGRESLFVGQIHSGEIYNQSPTEFRLSATRRWLSGTSVQDVEDEYRELLQRVAQETGTSIDGQFHLTRDAFEIDPDEPLVTAFQSVFELLTGETLPEGAKPFVDDGNTFVSRGGIPAITHGPNAKGAHTLHEEVAVSELERVALVYALTAITYCRD